ncbi:roadblock/LC7 domain-containing protein [Streptomyces sp. NBC_00879]|uniref:roadblock/LC7 domain-containing protein n=1 Tax=Streptomyces sp. NBC_00879 TaxID=2975855 RepID=UPI00386517DC|nr:roadblock/LC7 domain-containing protein [Streptomyces sp. NBC_00879]
MNDLVIRVEEIRHALLVSGDGRPIGASHTLAYEDAEYLAGAACGIHTLANGAGRHIGSGLARQAMVEMDHGLLFITAVGDGNRLVVISSALADVRLVAYEMTLVIKSLRERRSTVPRPRQRREANGTSCG